MRRQFFAASALVAATTLAGLPGRCSPGPPAGSALVSPSAGPAPRHGGYRRTRHYGLGHYYGHYYGHYRRHVYGAASAPAAGADAGADSFVRDGRRYYWHYQGGHRFYSSRPPAGDEGGVSNPINGPGEDLEAPVSHEEHLARQARMRKAQARLSGIEKRLSRERHLHRLRAKAALLKRK